jgi:predicted Zn finger-like uncharacterized protein
MIVICTNCKAKFRVADDRIGARGAKVRCSRCHTIFHVLAGAPPAPEVAHDAPPPAPPPRGMDVELENPFAGPAGIAPGAASPDADPFAVAGLGAGEAPPPLPVPAEPDPFAAAVPPPLPISAEPDPFDAAATVPPPLHAHPDPFVAAAPAADDPFALHAASDPFASPPPDDFDPAPGPVPSAATDLSQLVGSPGPEELEPAPELGLEPGVHLSPPEPEQDDGGLALEERSPIAPPHIAPPRPPLEPGGGLGPAQSADGFVMVGDGRAFEAYDFGSPGTGPALALDTGSVAGAVPSAHPAAAFAAAVPAGIAEPPAPPPPPRPDAASEVAGPTRERIAPARRSRLRAAVLNTLALAVLLAVTLGILVVWRSEGAIDSLSSLRPGAVLAALGRGGAASPFAAVDVRSGLYEREKGPPVLFVRGKVISRAPAAVRGVKVLVELVRGDGVLARGEALAGAVPTPEELYQVGDGPALAGLAEAAARRAPAEIRPGDAVPFLVAIADVPADLDGASVRVELSSAGAPRR